MRDVKPTEMTSWLCHLLFLDGQGLHTGGQVFSGTAVLGGWGVEWGCEGRWGGGNELLVHSQEGGDVCRELESAHGSKTCL